MAKKVTPTTENIAPPSATTGRTGDAGEQPKTVTLPKKHIEFLYEDITLDKAVVDSIAQAQADYLADRGARMKQMRDLAKASYQSRIETLEKAKTGTTTKYEEEIEKYRGLIAGLEESTEEDESTATTTKKTTAKKTVKKTVKKTP